jgi:Zn finger protein HypA/HybF involved in hydrogenase expression
MKSKLYEISYDDFKKIVSSSSSMAEIIRKCQLSYDGGNLGHVKNRIIKDNIDVHHIPNGRNHNLGRGFSKISKEKVLNEFCVENSKYNRGSLKKHIIKFGLIPYKCKCGLSNSWDGKPLVLVLDHINGINNDNRLENLRFICPNCNSQTATFAGRNCKRKKVYKKCAGCGTNLNYKKSDTCIKCFALSRRRIERPAKEDLEEMIKIKSFVSLGKEYGVSDNAVRKWCKSYGIIPK